MKSSFVKKCFLPPTASTANTLRLGLHKLLLQKYSLKAVLNKNIVLKSRLPDELINSVNEMILVALSSLISYVAIIEMYIYQR